MLRSRRTLFIAGGVALALLLTFVVVVVTRDSTKVGGKGDLLAATVDVVGCPHAEAVQVRARLITHSVRTPRKGGAGFVKPNRQILPRLLPSATAAPTPSPTPTLVGSPSPTLVPTPTRTPPTATASPTRTPPPPYTPPPTSTGKPVPPMRAQAVTVAPLPVTATVQDGRYRLTGLTKGQLYQVGAAVPGCAAKLVVPHSGLFVAGLTPTPPLAVVQPPKVRRRGAQVTWDAGGTKTTWTLSTNAGGQGCGTPAGVVQSGDLDAGKGTFALDPIGAAKKAKQAGYGGSLFLRVQQKDGPCAPSLTLPVPLVVDGLPQDGATQLEVYDWPYLQKSGWGNCDVCVPGLYDPFLWKGSSAFDWDEPTLSTRPFHWSSSAPGTAKGRWQLSESLLPDTCTATGVLAEGDVDWAAGDYTNQSYSTPPNFIIDFHDRGLQHGTYYLRVVPLNDKGGCSGPASASVTLSWKEKDKPAGFPVPNKPPAFAHVVTSFVGFQKLTEEAPSPPYCFVALADHDVTSDVTKLADDVVGFATLGIGGHVSKGQEVCFTPSTDDGGSFWDDLTSVVDFVLDVVSFPAKVYDLYQQIIPNILAELIPGCEETCKQAILIAEKAALASVGLPPSLPDASRIVHDGEDYLVSQAAEETGVPEVAVRAAYEKGKEAITNQLAAASTNQTGMTCSWCAFDNGVRAPGVKIVISRPADDDPSLPLPSRVCVSNTASPHDSGYVTHVAEPLFTGGCVNVPKSFPPGSTLQVPIALTPNVSEIRWKVLQLWYDSKSALGGSESEIDNQAFAAWKGQQNHTKFVIFKATAYGSYDAGPSFGQSQATLDTSLGFFPI